MSKTFVTVILHVRSSREIKIEQNLLRFSHPPINCEYCSEQLYGYYILIKSIVAFTGHVLVFPFIQYFFFETRENTTSSKIETYNISYSLKMSLSAPTDRPYAMMLSPSIIDRTTNQTAVDASQSISSESIQE